MAALRLSLLGALDIRHDDQQVPKPPTLKSQSLLAYPVLHRRRARIVNSWPVCSGVTALAKGASLEQYHRCREIVLEELGAEPMAETTELYQAILDGRFEIGPPPEFAPVAVQAKVAEGNPSKRR